MTDRRRYSLLPLLLFLSALSISPSWATEKMNVLFISVDDLRVEVGCYGNTPALTPYIDRLAATGMRFDRAYCQQAVCNPSRASVITGLRPDTLRIWNLQTHFRETHPNVITLPQHFKQHGYHTRNIGKTLHNRLKGDPISWSVPATMHFAGHSDDKAKVAPLPPNLIATPYSECREGTFAERVRDTAGA